MNTVRKVLVIGANGATGRAIVTAASAAGHAVTAGVREPVAPVVRVDVRDPVSVRAAVEGQEVVVSAIGPPGRTAAGLYSAGARTIVDAMVAAGVPRLIVLSSSGVRRGDPHHPLWYRVVARTVLRELYADMRRMEEIVAASPLDWTVVRPTRIVDEPPTGLRVVDGGNPASGTAVSRTELARFVVAEIDAPQWSRAHPTLAR